MPNRNGMGPEGKGPATGRKLGNCKKNIKTNLENENTKVLDEINKEEDNGVIGRSQGRGLGRGNGRGKNRNI